MIDELAKLAPKNFTNRFAQMQTELDRHQDVIALREEHPGRESKISELYHYAKSCDRCRQCPGLEACQNEFPGHRMKPDPDQLKDDRMNFVLRPCVLQEAFEKQQQIQKLINCHNVKDGIKDSTFDTLDMDPQRRPSIVECIKFCSEFERDKTVHGLYLYGSYGVGKSRIAGAIANELAKFGVDVALVYVPDFLEEVKDAIGTNTVQEKVEALKKVTVLIMDDFGAETLTNWTRDGVIGAILNDRMERLVTIYTSNLNLAELKQHLAKTKEGIDYKKADRLLERIEPFVKVVSVNGRNRRRSG